MNQFAILYAGRFTAAAASIVRRKATIDAVDKFFNLASIQKFNSDTPP